MIGICKQCGQPFELTDSEVKFYNSKGLNLPKRCKDCREKNKQNGLHNIDTNNNSYYKKPKIIISLFSLIFVLAGIFVYSLINMNYSIDSSYQAPEISVEDSAISSQNVDIPTEKTDTEQQTEEAQNPEMTKIYRFANTKKLLQHYEKHGKEMGFESAEAYEEAASNVVNNPEALHKTEKEDGDDVYYIESTNEFVVVSTNGKIRTYFKPDRGKAYYDSQ